MPVEVIMPKVDMDQETGTVLEWLFEEGAAVKEGEPLLVIETDKVSIEVEAPGEGILQGVTAEIGDVIPVGEVIAFLLAPGEALPPQGEDSAPNSQPEPASSGNAREVAPGSSQATPLARRIADQEGIDLSEVAGTGRGGLITRSDLAGSGGPVRATPAARRLARESGVNIEAVDGSGPFGRVQQHDVENFNHAKGQPTVFAGGDEITRIPMDRMRRRIADRLTESYQQIPHITFTSKVDMRSFVDARAQLNAYAEQHGQDRISVTALFVKIASMVLKEHPYLNASLVGDEIWLHRDINMGVAVALETGLIVPVIRAADAKGIGQIAAELEDLVRRARAGQLALEEVREGTFTISNLGPFGIEQFTAIINPPQVGILAIGATENEVVASDDGQTLVRPIMRMTLSVDHRIVDGAVAAQFMRALKSVLEAPILLLNSE